jgi:hypothetical protein
VGASFRGRTTPARFADLGDGTNASISIWMSTEAAESSMAAARTWVAANAADLGRLTEDRIGRLGFVVGELAAVAA